MRDVALVRPVADADLAREDVVKAEYSVQDGRFSGPVRPDQAQRLLARHGQVDPVQNFHAPITGVQVFDHQKRVVVCQRHDVGDTDVFSDGRRLLRDRLD